MKVEQLTCSIGAELTGVRLSDAIHDEGLFAEIRQALLKHRVVFLRDQDISRPDRRYGSNRARVSRSRHSGLSTKTGRPAVREDS